MHGMELIFVSTFLSKPLQPHCTASCPSSKQEKGAHLDCEALDCVAAFCSSSCFHLQHNIMSCIGTLAAPLLTAARASCVHI